VLTEKRVNSSLSSDLLQFLSHEARAKRELVEAGLGRKVRGRQANLDRRINEIHELIMTLWTARRKVVTQHPVIFSTPICVALVLNRVSHKSATGASLARIINTESSFY